MKDNKNFKKIVQNVQFEDSQGDSQEKSGAFSAKDRPCVPIGKRKTAEGSNPSAVYSFGGALRNSSVTPI